METIAVYWESKIKTFGFEIKTNRCLFDWIIDERNCDRLEDVMALMETSSLPFDLIYGTQIPGNCNGSLGFKVSIVFPLSDRNRLIEELAVKQSLAPLKIMNRISHVDLLYFLGPHFQDRYGITDFTFKAIINGGFSPLATVFSGSSVYVVVARGNADALKHFFNERFDVPKPKSRLDRTI